MVDGFLMLIFFTLCIGNTYAQSGKDNPFPRVIVPDSIAVQLREAYKSTTTTRCNAEANVYNYIDPTDYDFKNGIYSFKGMGPHFPRRIFIFNDGRLFIFDNAGFDAPKEVIHEFTRAMDSLHLSSDQVVQYVKAISEYLELESDRTYGREIIE